MQRLLDRLVARQRAKLLRIERETTDALEAAHARLVADMQREIGALEREIAAAQGAGETVNAMWLLRGGRLSGLLSSIRERVADYGATAERLVTRGQRAMASAGADAAGDALAEATDPIAERLAAAGLNPLAFDRVPVEALDALAGRMHMNGARLATLFDGFGAEAVSKARGLLYLATALGNNPTDIATLLSKALNISRNRAMAIARTEMMGAYRDATLATYRANQDVCTGWVWVAAAGACPICVDLDGSEHGLDEDFDGAHVNCRCTCTPLTRSYDDILADIA